MARLVALRAEPYPRYLRGLEGDLGEKNYATIAPHFQEGGGCFMAIERDGPYVWATWLAKLMAGEINCEWAPWFKTHYQKWDRVPSDFNQAAWQMEHTKLSRDVRSEQEAASDTVYIENQNTFHWQREGSELVVGGKPDIVSIGTNLVTVIDCKTGQPKASDQIQVMIYMYCLPQEAPVYRDHILNGRLVYSGHRVDIPEAAIDAKFEQQFNYFLDILDSPNPAVRVPSAGECRYCDITKADCPDRIEVSDDAKAGDEAWA